MLVRCVRVIVIGSMISSGNDNPTTSFFFHVSYARRCILCHIASDHELECGLDTASRFDLQALSPVRLSTDTVLFGIATFLTVQ